MEAVVSVFIGIGCSFLFWWIMTKIMIPKVEFTSQIVRMPKNQEGLYRYAARILNSGKRNIIDVDIKVLISIKGLFADLKDLEHEFFLKTTFTNYPILYSARNEDNSLMFKLLPHETAEFDREVYPEYIRNARKRGVLNLDDVFSINENVHMEIILTGYDEYSGSRKLFLSQTYIKADIVDGYYIGNTLEIKQDEHSDSVQL